MQPRVRGSQAQESEPDNLMDYLGKLCNDFQKAQRANMMSRYYTWAMCELFWRGRQMVWFNPDSGKMEQMKDADTDLYFINNILLPFVEQISAEYAASNPNLIAYSEDPHDKHSAAAVAAAQHWIDCQRETMWDDEDLQNESHLVQFRGVVPTRTYYDPIKQQIRSVAVDALQVGIWDRARRLSESPFLIFDEVALKADMMELYGIDRLPANDTTSWFGAWNGQPDGLSFKRQLEIAIGNTGEADASSGWSIYTSHADPSNVIDNLTCRHSQVYLQPRVYRNYIVKANTRLPGLNIMIGSDTKLGEIYEKGLKLCKVNGEILNAYNLDMMDEWDAYKFQVGGAGFYGVGIENLLAQQEWFNEFVSIMTSAAIYAGAGITVANTQKIKNGHMLNKPGVIGAIDDLYPGEKVGDLIAHYDTAGLDPVLMQLPTFIKESMQFTSGARANNVSGLPGPGIETATGNQNAKAQADTFSSMRLMLRARNQARRMEQALKLFQQYQTEPKYYSRYEETEGQWLRGADVGGTIKVRVETDSQQPRTNFDARNDMVALINLGYGQNKMRPDVEAELGRTFKAPPALNKIDDWTIKWQKRMDAIQEAAGMAGQMMQERGVDPEMAGEFIIDEALRVGAPQPLDDHGLMAQLYRDYSLSDEFEEAPDPFKQVIVLLVQAHEQGGVMEMQKQAAQQVEAEAPIQEAQAAQQAEASEAEATNAEAKADADHQRAGQQATQAALLKAMTEGAKGEKK